VCAGRRRYRPSTSGALCRAAATNFVAREKNKIKKHHHEVHVLAETVEIGEFCKIVQMVQKGEREARQA
jgi:hypothetical protein